MCLQSVADDKDTEYPCPKLRISVNILILRAVLGWLVPNLLILSNIKDIKALILEKISLSSATDCIGGEGLCILFYSINYLF